MSSKKILIVFLLTLVVVNAIQSFFTELLNDEAYYWLWSKHLALGYFDHPPLTALFIAVGDLLFHHELGVRLFFVLSNALTVYLLYCLLQPSSIKLFLAVLISISPVLAAGFFAAPDILLVLFTAVFFLIYKYYLDKDTVLHSLALGACMALMLYSKYHGVLVIFFVLLSNPLLLKRKSFYTACIFGFILFSPHLWWQWQNNFPTFRFHLLERVPELYSWHRIADYIGGQILMAGIPCGLIFLYASVKYKTKNKLERALKFQLWGVYLFFLISSFNGRTEANWTAVNSIPLVYFSYSYLANNQNSKKWIYRLLPLSILTFITVRVHFGTDLTQKYLGIATETQHWKEWTDSIAKYAQYRPVVFLSSYQRASKYSFYSGKTGFTTTEVGMRKSQFNLWNIEEQIQNKQVYVCTNWGLVPTRAISSHPFKTKLMELDGFVCDSFLSWNKIIIKPERNKYEVKSGEILSVPVSIENPYSKHPPPNNLSRITYRIYNSRHQKLNNYNETGVLLNEALQQIKFSIQIQVPDSSGRYKLFIAASQDNLPPPINSSAVELIVK